MTRASIRDQRLSRTECRPLAEQTIYTHTMLRREGISLRLLLLCPSCVNMDSYREVGMRHRQGASRK